MIEEVLERQDWLEPVEAGLQKGVAGAFDSAGTAGRAARNFLHGVWLGHPLHPVLTDVPLGAWTAAVVLDAMEAAGNRGCARGADIAVQVGLAGAVGAAITGLTDWQATDGRARRVGVVHGLLNIVATSIMTGSLFARKSGNRGLGRGLALTGYVIGAASAWLGGELVYGEQIGVNHAAGTNPPKEWTDVRAASVVREGEPRRADAGEARVLLVRRGEEICAIGEVCSHLGGPLAEGKLEGDVIECPWHASRFCVRDGSVVDGPATHPQPRFEVREREGRVEVRGSQAG